MEPLRKLPDPEHCKIEKFSVSADFWSCLVEEPDACPYLVSVGGSRICSLGSRSGARLKRKIEDRKVYVRYRDNSPGVVARARLAELIESGLITAFERSSGWVHLDKDPIRRKDSQWQFKGLRRRAGDSRITPAKSCFSGSGFRRRGPPCR